MEIIKFVAGIGFFFFGLCIADIKAREFHYHDILTLCALFIGCSIVLAA